MAGRRLEIVSEGKIAVAALYKFVRVTDPAAWQSQLLDLLHAHGIKGTLIVAHEGVNGTIAGLPDNIEAVVSAIRALPGCADIDVKFSHAAEMPFYRTKVTVKKEIVTLGVDGVDPNTQAGTYVDPAEWNALIADPNTLIIDTRNDYEVGIGTFEGAVDPNTESFRSFPEWFRENREKLLEGKTKVAMFCTGGIRCEKSTSFLRSEGIDDVYHLRGGILRYLEEVPEADSKWNGECFVFDQRVSVKHGLELGTYGRCHGCREPLSQMDMASPEYEEGICCPHCYGTRDERRARYAERQKQVSLARVRGDAHLGAVRNRGRHG